MPATLGMETALLTATRMTLFFGCYKYLLRILYSDLQSLSTPAHGKGGPAAASENAGDDDIELDLLPLPSTHTPKSASTFSTDSSYLISTISRTMFSWCFSESCMLFILLILQGSNRLSPQTRFVNWRFSLFFLMAAILVGIPMCFAVLLSLGSSGRSLRGLKAFLSLIPVMVYVYGLSLIPIPMGLQTADMSSAVLSRLVVLGTIILGLLSGFGAVSSSWKYIPFINRSIPTPSDREIEMAEYSLANVVDQVQTRRREMARRVESGPASQSWFSRVGATFRGGDSLTQELRGLEALEYEMGRKLELLRERKKEADFDRTLGGRLFNFAGRLFALYCVIRVFSSLYNILFRSQRTASGTTYPDILTEFLAYTLAKVSSDQKFSHEDLASFARQISLVLVGIIILSSIRLTLRGVTRVLRVTSRNLAASLMLLVLAQLMSIYLLSTIVQMRASFPPPETSEFPTLEAPTTPNTTTSNLFSTIPGYETFGSLFDWSFLGAAAASLFARWGADKVNGAGDGD